MNTIVINNQKGGVGKTTLAVHLAWFMAEAGRRVLMIDVDAQGNATDTLKQHTGSTSAADLFKPATRFSFCCASLRNTSPRCRLNSPYSVFLRHFGMNTT